MMSNEEIVATIEKRYQDKHQVDGISFVSIKQPDEWGDRYATDDDNAVFTGMYLAAASYRYATTGKKEDLRAVMGALQGIRLLTNVSPVAGMLARWAFPLENAWDRIGYDPVMSLKSETNTYGQHIKSGRLYTGKGYAFLTKTTRDQLSGVLFGLTAAFTHVREARPVVELIISSMYHRLKYTGWSLVDHAGKTGTSAHKVDAAQRLVVKSLYNAATENGKRERSMFMRFIWFTTAHYNRIFTRTFSFSLNAMDAHSLFLLSDFHKEGKGTLRWIKRIQSFMKCDDNPHFDALYYAATGEPVSFRSKMNLHKRMRNNYPAFFSWQKDPDSWWGESETKEGPGIDALLPYWIIEHSRKRAKR
jgi:hypothetical protein